MGLEGSWLYRFLTCCSACATEQQNLRPDLPRLRYKAASIGVSLKHVKNLNMYVREVHLIDLGIIIIASQKHPLL